MPMTPDQAGRFAKARAPYLEAGDEPRILGICREIDGDISSPGSQGRDSFSYSCADEVTKHDAEVVADLYRQDGWEVDVSVCNPDYPDRWWFIQLTRPKPQKSVLRQALDQAREAFNLSPAVREKPEKPRPAHDRYTKRNEERRAKALPSAHTCTAANPYRKALHGSTVHPDVADGVCPHCGAKFNSTVWPDHEL